MTPAERAQVRRLVHSIVRAADREMPGDPWTYVDQVRAKEDFSFMLNDEQLHEFERQLAQQGFA